MTTTVERRRRASERGQSLTLLVLTMATMGVMAMLAITVGQVLVRRHQAQLVVDAAAMAGAAEQAKGLNTIARINMRELEFLNALAYSQAAGVASGYEDNQSTTWARIGRLVCGPCYGDDWAGDNWKSYNGDVFGKFNMAADLVNIEYSPYIKPDSAAKKVVTENFNASDSLFKGETPEMGLVTSVFEMAYPERLTKLVTFRERQDYRIGGARWYSPNSGHLSVTCPESIGPLPNPPCILLKNARRAAYIKENAIFNGKALFGDVPRYTLGNFYGTPKDRDIRFTYYLQVGVAKPIFGADYLEEIPKIVVMASAKPYGGHLGDEFDERSFSTNLVSLGYDEQDDKEIAPTYRAKLVPVRLIDRMQLATMIGGDDAERFITVFH